MNKLILFLAIGIVFVSGCASQLRFNEQQLELNARLIDNANIDQINECARLEDSCDGWKCLCDTYATKELKESYCRSYEQLCVNDICREITTEVDGVNFMESHFGNERYSGCVFVYDKVVELDGIKPQDIDNKTLICLADYRNSQDIKDWHITSYYLYDGKFLDDESNLINCESYEQ